MGQERASEASMPLLGGQKGAQVLWMAKAYTWQQAAAGRQRSLCTTKSVKGQHRSVCGAGGCHRGT